MKPFLLFSFVLFLSNFAFSQTVIESPKVGMSTASNVKLEKVELLNTATVLWFHVDDKPGRWISIPEKTYVQPVGSDKKLYVDSAEGIPIEERYTIPESGKVDYKLYFPAIDTSVSKLDFGEGNARGSWFIYDIQLKPELFQSMIPEKLNGSWFRSDNAQWEISLFDSVAVYKNQVWKYGDYSEKNDISKISLKDGSDLLTIYAKSVNDSVCMFGETSELLVKYSSQPNEAMISVDEEQYQSAVFEVDTVIYRGYIQNFSPRFPQRTGMIYVNDVLTGKQVSHLLKIADDGSFEVKFPHCNPQSVFVRMPFSSERVFIEPGKTTFELFDLGNRIQPVLFMGDCARTNSELYQLKNIRSFDYQKMQRKILEFSPEQYKKWCDELHQQDIEELGNYEKDHPISAKAKQIRKLDFSYSYAGIKMSYGMNSVSAWRKKNKIPRDQRKIDFEPAKPDSSYYDFLTNDLVNNPLAVLTSEYSSFINRLMYLDILRGDNSDHCLTTQDILRELKKAGSQLTTEEQELEKLLEKQNMPEFSKLQDEFKNQFGEQENSFHQKYGTKLQSLYSEKKGENITPEMIEEYLANQNVEFSAEEKEYLVGWKIFCNNPIAKSVFSISEEQRELTSKVHSEHREFINNWFSKKRIEVRTEKIQRVLGIEQGLATDIMISQDYCRPIVSEMTPASDAEIESIKKQIGTPSIADYIALMNQNTKAKVEANKKMTVAHVNEVPKTEGDKIFEAIMEKYKGKVVYVDFWATWCAPCRSGIERIKPLKDEMKDENVAFVYITNQTSPKGTYDNMIPAIKGEHYRVSADEWNILSDKFNISGIPHYTLVGKDGRVINPHLGHLQNPQLKSMLMKYINE